MEDTFKAEADEVAQRHNLKGSLLQELRARGYTVDKFNQVDLPSGHDQGVHILKDGQELITVVSSDVALSVIYGMDAILEAEASGESFPLPRQSY